ncbi:MAG: hypothetical protein LBV20_07325, partial [Treponema sp.]|nr:hypothetical protein [Treponema sp.]
GADDRLYQNIFVGGKTNRSVGTAKFDACPASFDEYMAIVAAFPVGADLEAFEKVEQPAYVNNNVYVGGAKAFAREESKLENAGFDAEYSIEDLGEEVYLNISLPQGFENFTSAPHGTKTLKRVRIVDAEFENPDGSDFILDSDLLNADTSSKSVAGPLSCLKAGKNRIKIWG